MQDNRKLVIEFLGEFGVKVIGFCEVPQEMMMLEIEGAFPMAVVFGFRLSETVLRTIKDRPTLIYKHHYKTINWILDQTSFHLARYMEDRGARALAIPASQTVDWEKQKGHVSHKIMAAAAGLGHIGRSGLVVHPEFGAHVRYATVLTDMEFPAGRRAATTCGECQKCIVACPAGAIAESGVDLGLCLDKLKEFSRIRGIGQYICGICVNVCDGRN